MGSSFYAESKWDAALFSLYSHQMHAALTICAPKLDIIKDNEKKVNKSISIIEGVRDDIDFVDAPRLQIS